MSLCANHLHLSDNMKHILLIAFVLLFASFNLSARQVNPQHKAPDKVETIGDTVRAYHTNPEDTEFWLCFQRNFNEEKEGIILELFLSGNEDASVTINIDGIGFTHNAFVPAGQVVVVRLPVKAEVRGEEIIERLAVHIKSDKAISVYGLNRRKLTTDSYLGLPVSVLGDEYRVMCYSLADRFTSQFAIVATEDSTEVEITLTANSTKHPANYPYKIILNKGDVYQVAGNYEKNSTCDLTGSRIKANKNISVFAGHQCAYVPRIYQACNHLVEQMPPLTSWGKHYYLGKQVSRTAFVYRVLANEKDTKIFEDNRYITTLNAGEFYEGESQKDIQLTATNPVLVAQYSMGMTAHRDSVGDPMMIMVSPTQQFLKEYRFATPVNGFWHHYINLIVPTKAISSLRLDGMQLPSGEFKPLGISRYSIAHLEVPFGSHKITGDLPFGLYSYGFGYKSDNCDAYGAMGGQSFVEYEFIPDSLPPMIEYKEVNGRIEIIARDDRVNDAGIKRIEILSAENISIEAPKFEEGISQLQFSIFPIDRSLSAKGLMYIYDAMMNYTTYSVCYYYDSNTDKYIFVFDENSNIPACQPKPPTQVGLIGNLHQNLTQCSDYDFISESTGFNHNKLINKSVSLYIAQQFLNRYAISATIGYTNYNGYSEIFGVQDSIRDEYTHQLLMHQNSLLQYVRGDVFDFALRGEYKINYGVYAFAGASLQYNANMELDIRENIVKPDDFFFDNGERAKRIDDPKFGKEHINNLSYGGVLGVGYNQYLGNAWNVFAELQYRMPFNSLMKNFDWKIHRLSLGLGVKYNF